MAELIKIINSHILIEFDRGRFDDWCVYLTKKGSRRYPPSDAEYFSRLQELGKVYSCQRIYNDFIKFYNPTDKAISLDILKMIDILAESYAGDEEEMNTWFTVIYAGIVAEENKEHAVLKKRIKRLGMHQALTENLTPEYAANFSKGKTVKELDLIMKALEI
ncbi:hypothetical protein [Pedobacter sp. Leaf176]|uniref:DUF7004 family protein n=1 Tax=Pedobacter sp. Leaf176 TaxID=1736286 RepID=UPI0006F5AAB7|nr:hypothetical protein [Pedobacter sp. Leaf176]KQR72666.1 hypothetical protein ASF92_05170 [Pedobacter sp. Leaf176]